MKQKLEINNNNAQSPRLRIVLCTLDSKYSHTSLALRLLREASNSLLAEDAELVLAEYTINDQPQLLLRRLYEHNADIYAFSCYIWNSQIISRLVSELGILMPESKIILGGPEAAWQQNDLMEKLPTVDFILSGEGETNLPPLLLSLSHKLESDRFCPGISGITWRDADGRVRSNAIDLMLLEADWPFAYSDLELISLNERILYYESSRGCPFGCTYCMSSRDRRVRYRELSKVFSELDKFIVADVKLVKFVDRTFNCDPARAFEIWSYLIEQHKKTGCRTRFHFEIAADLLDNAALELLNMVPEGLFQFEIGVQSCSQNVLNLIDRACNLELLFKNSRYLRNKGLIHLHLDLIAGLPSDDLNQFISSFDKIMSLSPHMLQLGFLKVLPGSIMREQAKERSMLWSEYPPYEILVSDAMSFSDILLLKRVETQLDRYYNSGNFVLTISQLLQHADSAFSLFAKLADVYREQGWEDIAPGRVAVWELLLKLLQSETAAKCFSDTPPQKDLIRDCLMIDYVCSGQKDQPAWHNALELSEAEDDKRLNRLMRELNREKYPDARRVRVERFSYDPSQLLRHRMKLQKHGHADIAAREEVLVSSVTNSNDENQRGCWLAVFDMSARLPKLIWQMNCSNNIYMEEHNNQG